jgi:hypothetical protein
VSKADRAGGQLIAENQKQGTMPHGTVLPFHLAKIAGSLLRVANHEEKRVKNFYDEIPA